MWWLPGELWKFKKKKKRQLEVFNFGGWGPPFWKIEKTGKQADWRTVSNLI